MPLTDVTAEGRCPKCGSKHVRRMGDAFGNDITWPTCEDCDWEGEP